MHLGENLRHLAPVKELAQCIRIVATREGIERMERPQPRCLRAGAFCSSENLPYEAFEILRSLLRDHVLLATNSGSDQYGFY